MCLMFSKQLGGCWCAETRNCGTSGKEKSQEKYLRFISFICLQISLSELVMNQTLPTNQGSGLQVAYQPQPAAVRFLTVLAA